MMVRERGAISTIAISTIFQMRFSKWESTFHKFSSPAAHSQFPNAQPASQPVSNISLETGPKSSPAFPKAGLQGKISYCSDLSTKTTKDYFKKVRVPGRPVRSGASETNDWWQEGGHSRDAPHPQGRLGTAGAHRARTVRKKFAIKMASLSGRKWPVHWPLLRMSGHSRS